jgi:hypothetical protein
MFLFWLPRTAGADELVPARRDPRAAGGNP